MKNFKLKPVNAAIAAAVAVIGAGALMSGDNPFSQTDLSDGYQNADGRIAKFDGANEGKCGEDKEAEGSCGEGHDDAEGKCGEGKCGEGKDAEGSCGEDKDAEGSCGEEADADEEDKDAEGSCGSK